MLEEISYKLIFIMPVIAWLGLLSIVLLISTASIGYLMHQGKLVDGFKKHKLLAALTIIVSLIHAVLGFALYVK